MTLQNETAHTHTEASPVPKRNYLYRFLRLLFKAATRGYFRRIVVVNREAIPKNVPLILVPNHTSAFMDPILLSTLIKQEAVFLARGEAFRKPAGRYMLGKMNALPVYREEIQPEMVHKNRDTFRKAFRLLDEGKTLFFFPEGVSKTEPRLRPLKKGLARLAFGSAEENNCQQDVCLLPVGITYSDPHSFQSSVLVQYGKPFYISEYADMYKKNKANAVKAVTEEVRSQLASLTLFIENEAHEPIVKTAAILSGFLEDSRPELILPNLNQVAVNLSAEEDKGLEEEAALYNRLKTSSGLKEETLRKASKIKAWKLFPFLILPAMAGLPLFIYGVVNNILPYWLAGWCTKKMSPREDFTGSLRLAAGTFGFLIFYILQTLAVSVTFSWIIAGIYLLSLPLSGLFALKYKTFAEAGLQKLKLISLRKNDPAFVLRLFELRQSLLARFEAKKVIHNES